MGFNIVLSSPSGAGKTTITKKISQKYPNIKISISHTTRKPRPNEIDGVDYHFVSKDKFESLIKENNFYEYAKIFDNFYGTSKKSVIKLHEENYDVVFDIDWQGTKKLSQFSNLKLIKLYLITENKTELKKRLIKRNLDTKNEVEKRFKSFEEDIKHWNDYDYVIINKNLDTCFKQIEKIILKNKEKKIYLFS